MDKQVLPLRRYGKCRSVNRLDFGVAGEGKELWWGIQVRLSLVDPR